MRPLHRDVTATESDHTGNRCNERVKGFGIFTIMNNRGITVRENGYYATDTGWIHNEAQKQFFDIQM